MSHVELAAFQQSGYVVLDPYDEPIDPTEWLGLEYVDWKSSGDTRFAPLASAQGAVECNGFWHFDPPRTDKDGVWIGAQTVVAPTLTRRASGGRRERRSVPRDRAAAQLVRRRALQLPPRRQQPSEPGRDRLGRALLHAADRRPRLVHGAAHRRRRPRHRDPDRAAGRRAAGRRLAADVALGVAPGHRSRGTA